MLNLHICTIGKDEEVMPALQKYMTGKDWKGAEILSGMGSVYDVTLGNVGSHDLKTLYKTDIDAPCEVTSFVGEITRKEDAAKNLPKEILDAAVSGYIIHVHMSCAHGNEANVSGGSLRRAKVLRALNVYILEHD